MNSLLLTTTHEQLFAKYEGVRTAATDGRTGPITIYFINMGFGRRVGFIDNILYRHFKHINHSSSLISIQPVEKMYDDNSTKR